MRHKLSEYLKLKESKTFLQQSVDQPEFKEVVQAMIVNHDEGGKQDHNIGQGDQGQGNLSSGGSQEGKLVPNMRRPIAVQVVENEVPGCSSDISYMTTSPPTAAEAKEQETSSSSVETVVTNIITGNEVTVESSGEGVNVAAIAAVSSWMDGQCFKEICVASKSELQATLNSNLYLFEKVKALEQERDRYQLELVNERWEHEKLKNAHATATADSETKEHETAIKEHTEALQKLAQDFQQLKEHNDAKLEKITGDFSRYQKLSDTVEKLERTASANSEELEKFGSDLKIEKADTVEVLNKTVGHLLELKKTNDAELQNFLKQLDKCKILIKTFCCKKGDEIRSLNESLEKYKTTYEKWEKRDPVKESIRMRSIKVELDTLKSDMKRSQISLQNFQQGVMTQFTNNHADLNNIGAQVYELQGNVENIVRRFESWRKEMPGYLLKQQETMVGRLSQQARDMNQRNAEKFAKITQDIHNLKQDHGKPNEVLNVVENLRGKVMKMEKNMEDFANLRKHVEENEEDEQRLSRKRKLISERKLTESPDISDNNHRTSITKLVKDHAQNVEKQNKQKLSSRNPKILRKTSKVTKETIAQRITEETENESNNSNKNIDEECYDETETSASESDNGSSFSVGYCSLRCRTGSMKIMRTEKVATRASSHHTINGKDRKTRSSKRRKPQKSGKQSKRN